MSDVLKAVLVFAIWSILRSIDQNFETIIIQNSYDINYVIRGLKSGLIRPSLKRLMIGRTVYQSAIRPISK